MNNPWKLATMAMALVMATALLTGLTTAYFTRPAATADAEPIAPAVPAPAARRAAATAYRAAGTSAPRPVLATPASVATPRPPATVAPPVPTQSVVYQPAPVTAVATTSVPADCATGGDRALRIAKPGVLGGLIGAGLGAAGGAIAHGGNGAGKGAAIGAVAGAALGGGYGAYKTKQECGTILGGPSASPTTVSQVSSAGPAPQAPFAPSDRITVFGAR